MLLATTAAPTYFKLVTNKEHIKGYENQEEVLYAYADGGLGANRPAYEALKILKNGDSREENAKILDNTIVLSLNFDKNASGSSAIPKIGVDGVIGWLVKGKLVSRLMQSSEDSSTAEVRVDLPGEDEFVEVKLPITKETSSLIVDLKTSEIDKFTMKTYTENFGKENMYGDITKISELDIPDHDILLAGFLLSTFFPSGF